MSHCFSSLIFLLTWLFSFKSIKTEFKIEKKCKWHIDDLTPKVSGIILMVLNLVYLYYGLYGTSNLFLSLPKFIIFYVKLVLIGFYVVRILQDLNVLWICFLLAGWKRNMILVTHISWWCFSCVIQRNFEKKILHFLQINFADKFKLK